jgi:hypothetical protein
MGTKLYWAAFAIIIAGAIALRAFWIYTLQLPFVTPDSPSYLRPLIEHWWLPISTRRTAGLPFLVSMSLQIFRHPAGILIVNGILAIASGTLLAIAIKNVLRQNLLSLIALFVVTFTAKNVAQEYYLMTEHGSRVFYIVYAALMLWVCQNPRRYWLAALIGLITTLNILIKPDAVVLIPATLLAFAAAFWAFASRRRDITITTAAFLLATVIPLLAYMAEFQRQFGTFDLTQAGGRNQFSHVGHLTLLDGGKHPELKERLKPLIVPYKRDYADKGNHQPNWLISGSADEQLRNDFGDKSPKSEVLDYVRQRYPEFTERWINEVYGDLALEGMKAHPVEYLRYAAQQGVTLWRGGYRFAYYEILPTRAHFERHRADRNIMRNRLYYIYGESEPPCGPDAKPPATAAGPLAAMFSSEILSCSPPPYDNPAIAGAARWVDVAYRLITLPLAAAFDYIPRIGAAAAILAGALLYRSRAGACTYAFGLLLSLVVLGYTMLHGLINVAESVRMTTNVQDYVVLAALSFVFSLGCLLRDLVRGMPSEVSASPAG